MNFLEERIVKDGVVKEGNILKVDSFLNHQMDINLFDQMGEEFKRRFAIRRSSLSWSLLLKMRNPPLSSTTVSTTCRTVFTSYRPSTRIASLMRVISFPPSALPPW